MDKVATIVLNLPIVGSVEMPQSWLLLGALGISTFVIFFLVDPFRIIEKVDERLVRLYKVPANGSAVKDKTFFCYVNPYSGNKDGLFQFHKVAYKLLKRAGAKEVQLVKTTHAGHFGELGGELAEKLMTGESNAAPDGGILIFGGDGSVCEFVNGVVKAASKGSMDLRDKIVQNVLKQIKFAHIPVGSANGIAASAGAITPYQAVVQIIEGGLVDAVEMDMSQVTFVDETSGETKRFVDLHCVSWGIITDHDELVERKWRHLGKGLKMLLAPMYVILKRQTYQGKVSFKPAEEDAEKRSLSQEKYRYEDPTSLPDDPARPGWKMIEGSFILASGTNLRALSYDMCVAPDIAFNDGHMALVILPGNLSRLQLVQAFFKMGNGTVGHLEGASLFKVSAFKLQGLSTEAFGASGENIENTKDVLVENIRGIGRYLKK